MRTILIEGASTAHGWFDDKLHGWANRLALGVMDYSQRDPTNAIIVDNRAVPGMALSGILKRFETDLAQAQLNSSGVTPVLSTGLNEARTFPGRTQSLVPADRFRVQLNQYFIVARAVSSPAILVGPQWVDEDLTQPVDKLGFSVTNDRLAEYGEIMRQVSDAKGATYVDIHNHFKENGGTELLSEDGCHPNALGHAAIYSQVLGAMKTIMN